MIAGPSGHGKTTTLAALVDLINTYDGPYHIITIEDPVEIVYPRARRRSSRSARSAPHTRSFAAALKGSLREDPDVIVIGELRDRETVEIALTAAETGHLVMATMSHAVGGQDDRSPDRHVPARRSAAGPRVARRRRCESIVAQRLLPSRRRRQGVVAAVELLTGVLPLAALIRDNKLFQLAEPACSAAARSA